MAYIGTKPADKPLTSADIADGIIVNADIANSTINLTTKVTGTLPLTNGGTGLATIGTANQVLAVNSGATALEYQAVSSDKVRLVTTTISSSVSSLEIATGFSDTYSIYELYWFNVKNSSQDRRIRIQFGYGSTPTYVTGSYKSSGTGVSVTNSDNTPYPVGLFSTDGIHLESSWNLYTTTAITFSGKITLFNCRSTSTVYKNGTVSNCIYSHSGDGYMVSGNSGGWNTDSTLTSNKVTAIKILIDSGTMDSGTFVLYGIKTS
jgi:hypothetical protein